jgi:hypothetical protein
MSLVHSRHQNKPHPVKHQQQQKVPAISRPQFLARPASPFVADETFFANSFGRSERTAFPARHISDPPIVSSSFCNNTW